MAETSGGLVKRSIQFTPEQLAWLQDRARSKGRASVAAVVRELIDAAMGESDVCPTCGREWER